MKYKYEHLLYTREQVRATPPNILLTNPTMLEYILLRQADATLIDPALKSLRWVAIDETHSYTGAVAACRLMSEGAKLLMECLMRGRVGELDEFRVPDSDTSHRCPFFLANKSCKLISVKWDVGSGPGLYSDKCPYEGFWRFCRYAVEANSLGTDPGFLRGQTPQKDR